MSLTSTRLITEALSLLLNHKFTSFECSLTALPNSLAQFVSITGQTVLAFNRLTAIADPLRFRNLTKRFWSVSWALLSVPSVLLAIFGAVQVGFRAEMDVEFGECQSAATHELWGLLSVILTMYLPLTLGVSAYAAVYVLVGKQSRSVAGEEERRMRMRGTLAAFGAYMVFVLTLLVTTVVFSIYRPPITAGAAVYFPLILLYRSTFATNPVSIW